MIGDVDSEDHYSYMYVHVLLAAEGGSIEPVEPPRYGPDTSYDVVLRICARKCLLVVRKFIMAPMGKF